ncbi:MAG: hypothetical protein M1817_002304 [Caeruleum heppii]|nr:MAG: hypothetical protein M1817_003511 [Caeruleum heppii]KAI9673666.1 MAG: hypothetical protein M1817_002304 [Caeruleum heppii]
MCASQPETGERSPTLMRDRPSYRPARPLPFELREHCVIYFEEELYTQALTLLTNLLTAGTSTHFLPDSSTSTSQPQLVPAFVPPPHHVSLISTLILHPSLTTRAPNAERQSASNAAYRYLRTLLKLVGPVNADLSSAFQFTSSTARRRGRSSYNRRREGEDLDSPNGSEAAFDTIGGDLANEQSVWSAAEDIWHVVGWAFNCSIVHPGRWTRWKAWLELMCEVLEDDWAERERLISPSTTADNSPNEATSQPDETLLNSSLLSIYLSSPTNSRHGPNTSRIMRAIFADGTPKSLNEFREVWKNETRERKKADDSRRTAQKRKRADTTTSCGVNLEEDVWGDWYAEEDDEEAEDDPMQATQDDDESRDASSDRSHSSDSDGSSLMDKTDRAAPNGAEPLGGIESLLLRQRLISLLSLHAAHSLNSNHSDPLNNLYDHLASHLRSLPLPTFALFIAPTLLPHMIPAARSSLCQVLLQSLISADAPAPDPSGDDLKQDQLEQWYLPYASNLASPVANAKVSLLVETLLRLLGLHVGLDTSTQSLREAVEMGIRARHEKVTAGLSKGRGRAGRGRGRGMAASRGGRVSHGTGGNQEEEEAMRFLKASGERMRILVDISERKNNSAT